jgi:hypothetical protein
MNLKSNRTIIMKTLKRIFAITFTFTILIGISACKNGTMNSNDQGEGDSEMNEKTEQIKDDMQQQKEVLKSKIKSAMDDFDKNIASFEANLNEKGGTLDEKTEETLDELKDKRKKLELKLDEITDKTSDSWEDFKTEVSDQTKDFQKGVKEFFQENIK